MPTNLSAQSGRRRDPTLLGRNFKKRLARGDLLIGGTLLEYARPSLIKLYCQAGYDFVFIDYEHAFFNTNDLVDTLICARDNGLPVISKTPQLERAEVAKLLDNGVTGIQLPRTESRRDLETLIDYMKFPPAGTRAGAPCFANVDYVIPSDHKAWVRNADASTVVVAHIETREGYRNAEEIITTPGLDMVYVGRYDFGISMGHPGDHRHPEMIEAVGRILKLCRKHRVPFGVSAASLDDARSWIRRGTQFFEASDELSLIRSGAGALVSEYRKFAK